MFEANTKLAPKLDVRLGRSLWKPGCLTFVSQLPVYYNLHIITAIPRAIHTAGLLSSCSILIYHKDGNLCQSQPKFSHIL